MPVARSTHVYLFSLGEFIKIGRSADPAKRLLAFSQLPYDARLIHSIASANAAQVENALHRRFRANRAKGEWFRLSPEDVARLQELERVDSESDLPDDLRPPLKQKLKLVTLLPGVEDELLKLAEEQGLSVQVVMTDIVARALWREGYITQGEGDAAREQTLALFP